MNLYRIPRSKRLIVTVLAVITVLSSLTNALNIPGLHGAGIWDFANLHRHDISAAVTGDNSSAVNPPDTGRIRSPVSDAHAPSVSIITVTVTVCDVSPVLSSQSSSTSESQAFSQKSTSPAANTAGEGSASHSYSRSTGGLTTSEGSTTSDTTTTL